VSGASTPSSDRKSGTDAADAQCRLALSSRADKVDGMFCDIRHLAAPNRTRMAVVVALSGFAFAICDSARSQVPAAAPRSGVQESSQDLPRGIDTPAPTTSQPSSAASQPLQPVTPRTENPGLINEIGKLLERRQPLFPGLIPSPPPQSSPDTDHAGTGLGAPYIKESGAGVPQLDLKIPSMQKGREKCPVAANGASDCKAAADALCRAHGYKEGRSTDTDATQKCSAEALLLSGRKSQPGACRTDYFVTRAWCQ
jgi:hypothetical protein